MIQFVDVKQCLGKAIVERRRTLALFIVSTIFIVALDAILMATSKQKYIVELIISILFTVLYLFFLVFYFTVLRKKIMNELNFYSSVDSATLNEMHVELIEFEENKKIYNGIDYFVLKAITINNLTEVEQFYYVPAKFEFKKGSKAILKTFGSVVIEKEDE